MSDETIEYIEFSLENARDYEHAKAMLDLANLGGDHAARIAARHFGLWKTDCKDSAESGQSPAHSGAAR